uniref:Uncharacterized protein n=1 Tax=Octopus bimaculoides TaxID=37653 RepID=A0A0L8G9B1_OCTBM
MKYPYVMAVNISHEYNNIGSYLSLLLSTCIPSLSHTHIYLLFLSLSLCHLTSSHILSHSFHI